MGAPSPRKKKKSIVHDPIYKVGFEEGANETKKLALSYLETRYMHPSVERGTPKADAILEVTRDLAAYLREH